MTPLIAGVIGGAVALAIIAVAGIALYLSVTGRMTL